MRFSRTKYEVELELRGDARTELKIYKTKKEALQRADDVAQVIFNMNIPLVWERAPTGWWITKEKKRLPIHDMSDGHLENAINMVKRLDKTDTKKYTELCEELSRRRDERKREEEDNDDFVLSGSFK